MAVPDWVPIVTGVGGLVVGVVVNPIIELIKVKPTTGQAREAVETTNATAQQANAVAAATSHRELFLEVAALARSEDAEARRQGRAMLEGLSQMKDLSPDVAVLVQAVTRPIIEGKLSEARAAEGTGQGPATFVVQPDQEEES